MRAAADLPLLCRWLSHNWGPAYLRDRLPNLLLLRRCRRCRRVNYGIAEYDFKHAGIRWERKVWRHDDYGLWPGV